MFKVVEHTLWTDDIGSYRSFGIQTPSGLEIKDVTTDYERISRFVALLNREAASEIQIKELIYDFLE